MASLQFTWLDLWNFYDALEDQRLKEYLEKEVVGDDWLFRQTAKEQSNILKHAPKTFVESIAGRLKPEVAIEFGHNPFLKGR